MFINQKKMYKNNGDNLTNKQNLNIKELTPKKKEYK